MQTLGSSTLSVSPVTTRIFRTGESLVDFVVEQVPAAAVSEGMVLAVTSKVVSLAEDRVIAKANVSKEQLVRREADTFLGQGGYGTFLTITHGLLIASAGIDESNSENDEYILYPRDPFSSARLLWGELRRRWGIQNLGVILTDSRTTPLRRGVSGVALAYWGFCALKSRVGSPDLFGRHMKMTTVNVADALAGIATLMMGETDESRPLAVVKCGGVEFTETTDSGELKIPVQDDLYFSPLEEISTKDPFPTHSAVR